MEDHVPDLPHQTVTILSPEMTPQLHYPCLEDFYRGGHIFITGATGFLGKLLLYTLLSKFSEIDTLYILVREKGGVAIEKRIDSLFESMIFDKLKLEMPTFQSKIKVVQGNMKESNLGISPDEYSRLTTNVNIIFHCAATVRFDEELSSAIRTNLCGTQAVLNLARKCLQLKCFTYVSTAFSNAYRHNIDEVVYPPKTHYSQLIPLSKIESIEDPQYVTARKRLSEENVNTYTLTKAAAEHLIQEEAGNIPVAIFRPSIVIATHEEPVPGWTGNLYGPTGFATGIMSGVFLSIHVNPSLRADFVPADWTVNAMICSAWHSANCYQSSASTQLPIYNYVSSTDNPITWIKFIDKLLGVNTLPFSKTLWKRIYFTTKSKLGHKIRSFFFHYLFGYIIDLWAPCIGMKLRLVPFYRKFDKMSTVLGPFTQNEWTFSNTNVKSLWARLSPVDQARFPFNIHALNWDDYVTSYQKGILVYHLKDKLDPDTRKQALQRYKRLCVTHQCIKTVLYLSLVCFIVWIITRAVSHYAASKSTQAIFS